MTRKDYIVLAQALKDARPDGQPERLDQWRFCVWSIMYALACDNPRFDQERFREACQYGD